MTFKLRAPGTEYFFKVKIHGSIKELRKSANRYSDYIGEKGASYGDALAVTHTFQRVKISPDGKEEQSLLVGLVRFSSKNISTQIVCHEVIHAALHQYRLTKNMVADFGEGCNEEEEDFAHIYDSLFRDMVKKLYKHKLWN